MITGAHSRTSLFIMMLARLLAGFLLIGCLLFIPAGTLVYWEAWLYIGLLFIPLSTYAVALLLKDPQVLERRMRLRESRTEQKKAIAGSSLLIFAIFPIAGFDQRFGWSEVPAIVVLISALVILLGFLLLFLTVRENRFAARVVEIQENQRVVSTGPYSIVRHPMYLAFCLIFLFTPLVLGSYWALMPALILPMVLASRIRNEEQLLLASLEGYEAYCRKVRKRLVPFIW